MANGRHDDEQALIGNDSDSPKIVEGTTNHPFISPSLRPSRQDGKGYIDERPDVDVTDVGESVESEDHSGSSIEEDIEEEGEEVFADEQTGTPRDGASEHSSTQVSPSGLLDTDDDKDEDEKDWEVEDEDWEMAHGGMCLRFGAEDQADLHLRLHQTLQSAPSAACCRPVNVFSHGIDRYDRRETPASSS